jgi:BirA family biotin operon repressor/biotin-[acetyl-CoA-carboxylase] ligase
MSIILYPNFLKMEYQFLLSISISLGIRDYIADNGLDSQIKWPNDIYVGSKKIAGILIKNAIIGSELKSSIVGIGLNVNQTKFRNNDIATSLSQELNKTFNLKEELNKLSNRMEIKYNQLREKPELEFIKMYEASMYYKDKTINFSKDNVKSHLTIRGINLEGKLVASDNFNKQVLISHGEGIITY